MIINTTLLYDNLPLLLRGLRVSISIAGFGCLIGTTLGTLFAIVQTQKHFAPLRIAVNIYTALIRGTPMLIQISGMFWVLPQLGVTISPFWIAVVAIGLNSSAYMSNIIRAGILSVGKGQWEAAYTLGLNRLQTLQYIVLPQAFRAVIPSLGNEFVTLIKDSSLASIIGVAELAKEGGFIVNRTYDAITIYVAVAALYLLVTIPLTLLINALEKRMHHAGH